MLQKSYHTKTTDLISRFIQSKMEHGFTAGELSAFLKENGARILQLVEEFAEKQTAGFVQFAEIADFKNKVLFLKGEKDAFLSEMNAELHKIVLPEFEKGENGYYLPEIWFPHTTLATRLNKTQFEKAQSLAEKITLPLKAKACEIGFYQCSPFVEVARFQLAEK